MTKGKNEVATVGGGCFWCVEAIVKRLKGVEKVESGYTGGKSSGKPTYVEICSGYTGHVEVVQITFNPSIISYEDLLGVFMTSHDPTTLNRQGADRGTQYRSVIFYHSEEQKNSAEKVLNEVQVYYSNPIVTEVSPLEIYYSAEDYHQDYYTNNSSTGYCVAVIDPKLKKLREKYKNLLKPEYE